MKWPWLYVLMLNCDFHPYRVIQDPLDRKAKQERRDELACLVGLARAAPWGLWDHQGLRVREATLGLQDQPGALGCPACLDPW